MSDTREKLSTSGSGFESQPKPTTEDNVLGKTTIQRGDPGKAQREVRMDKDGSMSTSRFPLKGANPKKDKWGDTKNTTHPKHGR